jgi:hypothetical protein
MELQGPYGDKDQTLRPPILSSSLELASRELRGRAGTSNSVNTVEGAANYRFGTL